MRNAAAVPSSVRVIPHAAANHDEMFAALTREIPNTGMMAITR